MVGIVVDCDVVAVPVLAAAMIVVPRRDGEEEAAEAEPIAAPAAEPGRTYRVRSRQYSVHVRRDVLADSADRRGPESWPCQRPLRRHAGTPTDRFRARAPFTANAPITANPAPGRAHSSARGVRDLPPMWPPPPPPSRPAACRADPQRDAPWPAEIPNSPSAVQAYRQKSDTDCPCSLLSSPCLKCSIQGPDCRRFFLARAHGVLLGGRRDPARHLARRRPSERRERWRGARPREWRGCGGEIGTINARIRTGRRHAQHARCLESARD